MGRRPDILIATYFDRGVKLQDASNRYSFTCRGCSALFPKGRTSHLIDHLIGNATRCPALAPEDIANIMAIRASKSAEKMQRASAKRPAAYTFLDQESLGTVQRKRQANHGIGENTSLSGLEALAEASRQVEWPTTQQSNTTVELERDVFIDPNLKALAGVFEAEPSSASDLSSIAASASNLEESLPTSRDLSTPKEDAAPMELHGLLSESLSEQLSRAANFPVLIAANSMADTTQIGTVVSPGKTSKSRSKFTQVRREEVRHVRSKRACIRCRMLRKPCSSDDPCTRCSSIKNPRIWSSKCTRGRLADVCDLYSARTYTQSIKSTVLKLQQTQGTTNRKDTLGVPFGNEQLSMVKFDLTALHRSLENGEICQVAECFVPCDLGYKECEQIRNLMNRFDVETFPKEVQLVIAWGRRLTIDAEAQLFHQASSLYRCVRFLATPSDNIDLYLLGNSDTMETQSSALLNTNTNHNLLNLAFRSMVEYVAQEDCHLLLKNIEQALVNRTLSNFAVFVSIVMLFSSLELLQHHFYSQQSIMDSEIAISNIPSWTLPDSPTKWATKLDDFSSFMQDLLRCRHIINDLDIDAQGVLTISPTSQDAAMKNLFSELNIDSSLLSRHNAAFVPDSPDSLYFKHTARLLLSSQGKDLIRTEK